MASPQTTAGTSPRPRPPQVFAFLFCSVDGFIEDAEHRLDWNTNDPELFVWNQRQARQAPHIGAVLLGRRTYDHFADFWTTPEAAEQFPEITAFMHEVPKTVVTTRPDSLRPGTVPAPPTAQTCPAWWRSFARSTTATSPSSEARSWLPDCWSKVSSTSCAFWSALSYWDAEQVSSTGWARACGSKLARQRCFPPATPC